MTTYTPNSLITYINAKLTHHEMERIEKGRQEMLTKAQMAHGAITNGFIHRGCRYIINNPSRAGVFPELPERLHDEADKLEADYTQVYTDRLKIRQALYCLFDSCQSNQELRDTVPRCLEQSLPEELLKCERINEPLCSVQDNPTSLRTVNKAIPLMEFYSVSRLIY